jgi:hypothetical protein
MIDIPPHVNLIIEKTYQFWREKSQHEDEQPLHVYTRWGIQASQSDQTLWKHKQTTLSYITKLIAAFLTVI